MNVLSPLNYSLAITTYSSRLNKSVISAGIVGALLLISGCQSMSKTAAISTTPVMQAQTLDSFLINGKIGVTMPVVPVAPSVSSPTEADSNTQGGSAFYVWGQENERFAIEIMGALGIGKTNIEYNGQTATLVSERTGTLTAEDPEELLQKATGWQAPISQMPYWISGRSAPSDSASQFDAQNRLISSVNGNWSASFRYDGNEILPDRITAVQPQGQKVVMTINHQKR